MADLEEEESQDAPELPCLETDGVVTCNDTETG